MNDNASISTLILIDIMAMLFIVYYCQHSELTSERRNEIADVVECACRLTPYTPMKKCVGVIVSLSKPCLECNIHRGRERNRLLVKYKR